MQCDYLLSDGGSVFLINCDVAKNRVLAGMAYFDGSLPAVMPLYNQQGTQVCRIRIPENVQRSQTITLLASAQDDIEFPVEKP